VQCREQSSVSARWEELCKVSESPTRARCLTQNEGRGEKASNVTSHDHDTRGWPASSHRHCKWTSALGRSHLGRQDAMYSPFFWSHPSLTCGSTAALRTRAGVGGPDRQHIPVKSSTNHAGQRALNGNPLPTEGVRSRVPHAATKEANQARLRLRAPTVRARGGREGGRECGSGQGVSGSIKSNAV
jgi:hypothetical protein